MRGYVCTTERRRLKIPRVTLTKISRPTLIGTAVVLVELLAAGCSSPAESRPARLMEEIEEQIELPPQAENIDKYVRFYAFDRKGKVLGRYVLPRVAVPRPKGVCQEIGPEGTSRELPCPPQAAWPKRGRAGERLWVSSPREFPVMLDGGCARINIQYDIASQKVERATCNVEG